METEICLNNCSIYIVWIELSDTLIVISGSVLLRIRWLHFNACELRAFRLEYLHSEYISWKSKFLYHLPKQFCKFQILALRRKILSIHTVGSTSVSFYVSIIVTIVYFRAFYSYCFYSTAIAALLFVTTIFYGMFLSWVYLSCIVRKITKYLQR